MEGGKPKLTDFLAKAFNFESNGGLVLGAGVFAGLAVSQMTSNTQATALAPVFTVAAMFVVKGVRAYRNYQQASASCNCE